MDSDMIIGPVLSGLNFLAIALFAATGALAGARKNQTMMTFIFLGLLAGLGGGTVRDVLLGAPLFWINSNAMPIVAIVASLCVWFVPAHWWRDDILNWFDAGALAAYAVYGAAKALDFGVDPAPAVLLGGIAAVAGGILRDIITGEPSLLLGDKIYVSAAFLASTIFVLLQQVGLAVPWAALSGALAGFALRGAAIRYDLCFPTYRGVQAKRD